MGGFGKLHSQTVFINQSRHACKIISSVKRKKAEQFCFFPLFYVSLTSFVPFKTHIFVFECITLNWQAFAELGLPRYFDIQQINICALK